MIVVRPGSLRPQLAPMPEDTMNTDRPCGRCGQTLRPGASIILVGTGELCLACFNAEMAQQLDVDFDDTPLAPVVLADHDGVPHSFEIRSRLAPTGHVMEAIEVAVPEREGYRFAVLGDFEANAWDLFQRGFHPRRPRRGHHRGRRRSAGWQRVRAERAATPRAGG